LHGFQDTVAGTTPVYDVLVDSAVLLGAQALKMKAPQMRLKLIAT